MDITVICVLSWDGQLAALQKAKKGNTAGRPDHCVVIGWWLLFQQGEYCLHDVQGDWSPDPWWLRDGVGFLYPFQNLLKTWGELLIKDGVLSGSYMHITDG